MHANNKVGVREGGEVLDPGDRGRPIGVPVGAILLVDPALFVLLQLKKGLLPPHRRVGGLAGEFFRRGVGRFASGRDGGLYYGRHHFLELLGRDCYCCFIRHGIDSPIHQIFRVSKSICPTLTRVSQTNVKPAFPARSKKHKSCVPPSRSFVTNHGAGILRNISTLNNVKPIPRPLHGWMESSTGIMGWNVPGVAGSPYIMGGPFSVFSQYNPPTASNLS